MADVKLSDEVRVVKLLHPNREFAGTMGVLRTPQLGDLGKVVFEYPPGKPYHVAVECFDEEGRTVWMADFRKIELELVSRPQ